MSKTTNDIRRFLFTCSGEDNYILKKCSTKIQARFALLGFFVVCIFIGCFLSATFFTKSLFDSAKWVSLPMGLIWGAVIVNLYLLLLHTISPTIIPLSSKKKKGMGEKISSEKTQFLTVSMCLRLAFMSLLAVITAQPLNVAFLSSSVELELEKHKILERVKLYTLSNETLIQQELQGLSEFNQRIIQKVTPEDAPNIHRNLLFVNNKIVADQAFIAFVSNRIKQLEVMEENWYLNEKESRKKQRLLKDIESQLNLELGSDQYFMQQLTAFQINGSIGDDYKIFQANLADLVQKKLDNYNSLSQLLEKSNFYIKTIQLLLMHNQASWIISSLVCLLFLLPIYFKYKVRDVSSAIFKRENSTNSEIVRLREELINTRDFNWLERKIKTIAINNIKTSDYYFHRMLIEHRIILEEYEQTKSKFSEILTDKNFNYNQASWSRLYLFIEKMREVDVNLCKEYVSQISSEYKDETIVKYEYWLDMPFRTKRIQTIKIKNTESDLLDFIYNQNGN
ncbi:DUF4407 domain-containing protein [Flavobacterium agrisoli]|uniref:DUF4407 domain-containing protein n=1 Tax=Flavobacterium agrisoli TaxID=2793066 RepID=A0A934PM57_9FLAO|nr:DUF4407 domain-containing protein [Flavobacterium agrisoli]MBK0370087.1 DUF4407 domain-containing protein [Flavobacterium agrisoli]